MNKVLKRYKYSNSRLWLSLFGSKLAFIFKMSSEQLCNAICDVLSQVLNNNSISSLCDWAISLSSVKDIYTVLFFWIEATISLDTFCVDVLNNGYIEGWDNKPMTSL